MLRNILALILVTTLGTPAMAECLTRCKPFLTITDDKNVGEVFVVGVDADEQGNLKQIYFENEKKEKQFFSLKDVQSGVVLYQTKRQASASTSNEKVYDLILLEASYLAAGKVANATFSYLYNGITHSYISESAQLNFDRESKSYKLFNKYGALITTGFVTTRLKTIFKKTFEIGIESITFK